MFLTFRLLLVRLVLPQRLEHLVRLMHLVRQPVLGYQAIPSLQLVLMFPQFPQCPMSPPSRQFLPLLMFQTFLPVPEHLVVRWDHFDQKFLLYRLHQNYLLFPPSLLLQRFLKFQTVLVRQVIP